MIIIAKRYRNCSLFTVYYLIFTTHYSLLTDFIQA